MDRWKFKCVSIRYTTKSLNNTDVPKTQSFFDVPGEKTVNSLNVYKGSGFKPTPNVAPGVDPKDVDQ